MSIKSSYYMNDSNDDELLHYVNIAIACNCFVFWFVHPFVFGPHISYSGRFWSGVG